MAKDNIEVTVHSNRKEYEAALEEIAEKVLTMWGMQAESAAKKRAPVDTGLLRNSITWAVAGQSPDIEVYSSGGAKTKTATTADGKKVAVKVKTGMYKGKAQSDPGGARHVYIGTNVEYAMAQETGNFKDGAHAFLRPAIDENRGYFKKILEEELKNALNNE